MSVKPRSLTIWTTYFIHLFERGPKSFTSFSAETWPTCWLFRAWLWCQQTHVRWVEWQGDKAGEWPALFKLLYFCLSVCLSSWVPSVYLFLSFCLSQAYRAVSGSQKPIRWNSTAFVREWLDRSTGQIRPRSGNAHHLTNNGEPLGAFHVTSDLTQTVPMQKQSLTINLLIVYIVDLPLCQRLQPQILLWSERLHFPKFICWNPNAQGDGLIGGGAFER